MADVLLNYSRSPRRIRWRGPILGVIVALALVVVGRKLDSIVRWRIPYLRNQWKCLNFTAPEDQVAYQEDGKRAPPLLGGVEGELTRVPAVDFVASPGAFYFFPEVLRHSRDSETGFAPDVTTACCLFLHGRRAKGNADRLVYVEINYTFANRNKYSTIGYNSPAALDWEVIKPGTLFSHPQRLASGQWGDATFHIQMPRPLLIYEGQPDPADSSHFTLRFVLPGRNDTIDGWLMPNDQLTFIVH